MKEVLMFVGVVFVVFSAIVFYEFRERGEKRGKEVTWGVFLAIWWLIAGGVCLWLLIIAVGWLTEP